MAAPERIGPQYAPGPIGPLVECGWKRGGAVVSPSCGRNQLTATLTPGGLLMEVSLDGQTMKHFRVSLRGENFLLNFDGQPTKMGFYATRFVQANNPEGAELLAVDLLQGDETLRGAANLRSDHPPMIFADEIDEVVAEEVPDSPAGFTFFLAEGSDA